MPETTLNPRTVVRRSNEVVFSRLDDELIAIDAEVGYCYSLNESAARIWDLLEAPASAESVCGRLRDEYAVDEATCLADVTRTLDDLRAAGLLEVDAPPA